MEVELEQVEKELRECKGLPQADKLATYLRLCRELRIRDSPSIARYGSLLLRNYKSFLSDDELWIVYEQCAIAALDAQATEFAASLIRAINKKFANSVRAKRLQAMYYEAIGELDRAETLYRQLLEISPNNEMVVKRMVALERSRGSLQGAAEALRKYVDVYPNDADAWEELAELYVELGLYRQAAFCYEELIMINPLQSNYNVRYADVLYTIGGNANWKTARAYYARVIEQTRGGSLRALYGVCACSANITDKVSVQDSRSRAQIELPEVTAQALQRVYKKEGSGKLPLVQDMLKKMGIL